jgi:hypothetical protein
VKSRQGLLVASVVAVALAVPVGAAVLTTSDPAKPPSPTPTTTTPVYGDGRASEAHDFRLANLHLPAKPGVPGVASFEILDAAARPVTTMLRERTKLLHLYVIRDDYSVFRHVFPRLADGTWSAPITLPAGGTYRAIAEFTVDAGDHNDHIYLASETTLPDSAGPGPQIDSKDKLLDVSIEDADRASAAGRFTLRVARRNGGRVKLDRHLGGPAQVTAFHQLTGRIGLANPAGPPQAEGDEVTLQLPTTGFRFTGLHMFFVEARVNGKVHTLRVAEHVG